MVSQYLLIHSEAIIATMKEISGKNSKTAIFYPSLTREGGGVGGVGVGVGGGGKTDPLLRRGGGGKTDPLLRLSTYAFPIPLNTF